MQVLVGTIHSPEKGGSKKMSQFFDFTTNRTRQSILSHASLGPVKACVSDAKLQRIARKKQSAIEAGIELIQVCMNPAFGISV